MHKCRIEICCFSFEDAIVAQKAGGHQIELCANRPEGGTTPSFGLLANLAPLLTIPTTVIIRPSAGNFHYTTEEWACMKEDIKCCKKLGFTAISIGLLTADQTKLDYAKLEELKDIGQGMKWIFHKAFDALQDPMQALLELKKLGFSAIMSSGQEKTALKGIEKLKKMKIKAEEQGIEIIAAGGIRSDNLKELVQSGCADVFHSAVCSNQAPTTEQPYGSRNTFSENEILSLLRVYHDIVIENQY